jgi:PP-loop superfamily ATP-utilizing enzyme
MTSLAEKENRLHEILKGLESAAVAFSGGVESSFL